MSGPLPRNLSQFSKLDSLSLVSNRFSGTLPDFTGLFSLRLLFLSNNQLNGPVPESIGKLFSLEVLILSSNNLNGVLTGDHFSNLSCLHSLDLSQNPLSFNLSSVWVPPFQLDTLVMTSCKVGPAFPKWLQTQKKLRSLYISNAGISDSIPNVFWDLSTRLIDLNLSYNQIHGKLPNLSQKNYTYYSFDLSYNHLEGRIPQLPPRISDFILSNKKFTGSLSPLCESQAPSLYRLDLSNNLLSGKLPNCWIQLQGLAFLNLAKNNISGKIPNSLAYLKNSILLRLHDNNFSGEIPSLKDCNELRILDLGRNRLSGRIPTWLGQGLPNLLVLRLRDDEFNGSLPLTLCCLPALVVLDLSHNKISGILPECLNNITALSYEVTDNIILGLVQVVWKGIEVEFGKNLKLLRSIDISSNNLSGVIPENITSLLKLISLNLSRNNLAGTIPGSFDKLGSLESLDLSRNWLSGRIPESFSSLNFLGYLDLSYNNLSGRLPLSTQLQSFNASEYEGNIGLCGPPLTKYCPGDEIDQDPNVPDANENDMNEGDHDGFYVSIAMGFIVGFWGVCGTLLLKSSWRSAYFRFWDHIKDWTYVETRVFKARLIRRMLTRDN